MIGLSVLGATGTIGTNTLDVVARHPDRYRVVSLTANRDDEAMFALCQTHRPDVAVMADSAAAQRLQDRLQAASIPTRVDAGSEGLCAAARDPQAAYVMAAIVGAAGLTPTLAAVEAGKRVLLANKEALVLAGQLFMDAAERSDALLMPIDSEHNAIFQCMPAGYRCGTRAPGVDHVLLTASGGPFRQWPLEKLESVTPEQAVSHPNWVMGHKISVDSATMMNKGLEAIEAAWLFGLEPAQIRIVIHPQSVIHSMVSYDDGSVLAQLGEPDMRTPIAQALAWPERIGSGVSAPDFTAMPPLEFEAPDEARFPCLKLARQAFEQGGHQPAALNAANEVAVQAFLQGQINFTGIARVIEQTLSQLSNSLSAASDSTTLEGLMSIDHEARQLSRRIVGGSTTPADRASRPPATTGEGDHA